MSTTLEVAIGLTGLTATYDLYPDGSDTPAVSGASLTEATNRKGLYTATLNAPTVTVTGVHWVKLYIGGAYFPAVLWVDVPSSGTVTTVSDRSAIDVSQVVRADDRNGDAVPTAAQIDTQLSNTHGNGTWESGAMSQTDINNIGDRIAETLGDNPIQIQSPATGDNTLDIVQGMDYYTADGRDIEFPFIADYVPTSCKLTLVSGTVQTVTSTDITESSGSGSGRFSVRFQIPRATGDELEAGAGTFEVLSILSNGHEVPEISEGVLTVRRRRTA